MKSEHAFTIHWSGWIAGHFQQPINITPIKLKQKPTKHTKTHKDQIEMDLVPRQTRPERKSHSNRAISLEVAIQHIVSGVKIDTKLGQNVYRTISICITDIFEFLDWIFSPPIAVKHRVRSKCDSLVLGSRFFFPSPSYDQRSLLSSSSFTLIYSPAKPMEICLRILDFYFDIRPKKSNLNYHRYI